MKRILLGLPAFLLFCAAHAQTQGATPPPAPDESSGLGLAVFAVLFFGACIGFAWFVWKNEKKAKQKNEEFEAKIRSKTERQA
ncbi:MAG TPA: hypothetical protein VKC64_12665 [Burkholderiales bacterium]|nr:hypothetical protein [Burkholderiales bacterium]